MFKILEAFKKKRDLINTDIGYITEKMETLISDCEKGLDDLDDHNGLPLVNEKLELLRTYVTHLESSEEICIDDEYDGLETEIEALYVANVEKNDYLFKKKFYDVVDNFLEWSKDENK